jgi:site-specific DNA recombinase
MNALELKEAIVYCRVSSLKQVREGHGLESQQIACEKYCRQKGYKVAKVFIDAAISGGQHERNGLNELFDFAKNHRDKRYVVVVNDLNRLARSTLLGIELYARVKDCGCKLESTNQTFDDTPTGNFMRSLYFGISEWEKEQNRERVISRMDAQLSKGRRMFGRPPAWYQVINGKMQPRQPNADILRLTYQGLVSGEVPNSRPGLIEFMASKGFSDIQSRPKPPSPDQIDTLRGENAIMEAAGQVKHADKWIPSDHAPIIPPELAHAVLEKLHGKPKQPKEKFNKRFPLCGLVRCSQCDSHLTASSPNKGDYSYYYCIQSDCIAKNKGTRAFILHDDFAGLLRNVTPRPKSYEKVKEILKEVWEEQQQSLKNSRRALEQRLTTCEQAIQAFLEDARNAAPVLKKELYTAAEKMGLDKAEVEEGLRIPSPDEMTSTKDFEDICDFIRSPYKLWTEGDRHQKNAIQKLVFRSPISYVAREGFRNVRYALPFGLFTEFDEQGEGLVDLTLALRKELLAGMETLAQALRFSSLAS